MLSKHTGLIILGNLMNDEAVGIFGAAMRVTMVSTFGLSAANMIVAPMISELYHKNKLSELQRLLTMVALGIFCVTAVFVGILIVGGKWMLSLFGYGFVEGFLPMIVLLIGEICNALCGSVGFIMVMTGHQNAAAIIVAGSLIINVLMCFLLIPPLGLTGSAIATCCATLFWNFAMLVYVNRKLHLNPSVFSIIRIRKEC